MFRVGGGQVPAFLLCGFWLRHTDEYYLDRFEAAVRKHPEVRECCLMTGGSDYVLRVDGENAGAFERIHKEVLSCCRAYYEFIRASRSGTSCGRSRARRS